MLQSGDRLTPVSARERIREIDMLRGFALLGVLLVNTQMFNDTLMSFSFSPFTYDSATDRTAALLIQVFATGKFYTLFSFLFGLGFYLFMERLQQKGVSPIPLFRRRLLYLLFFGVLHMIFFWYGDILTAYAFTGFLLTLFWKKNPEVLKKWIIILLLLSTLFLSFIMAGQMVRMDQLSDAQYKAYAAGVQETVELYRDGSYLDTLRFRLQYELKMVYISFMFWIPKILALFLAGLYTGKVGLFRNLSEKKSLIQKYFRRSAFIGWPLTLLYVALDAGVIPLNPFTERFIAELAKEVTTVAVCLFYLTGLLLLWQQPAWRRKLESFEQVGRLAFTHYLTQSVILTLLFYGHGLGLMHRIPIWQGVIITLMIYGLQMIISRPMLRRWGHGPMEILWRKGTYGGKLETLKRVE
ncbi:MAG: DUF418 domain-containing protein [Bacillota bacterium]|nr:DUF418 domain-containing protein [Bacillota bacterium]MDW7676233.1 DUF418 domain-containing protein [Bacillota bacterium]